MVKQVIIFIAPPGAGKGTQADLLAKRLGLVHLETSKIIEEKLKNADPNDPVMAEQKKRWADGEINDPHMVAKWFLGRVREIAAAGQGAVFSGSPRTLYEAEVDTPVLEELYEKENIKIIHITLSEKESIKRNSNRRICQKNRHPIPNFPEYADVTTCPFGDGSLLITRELDKPEIIEERLKVYKIETEPVLAYLKEHGYNVVTINGEQPIEKVTEDILKNF